ncbi:MFS general substrate transporter [Xylariaceae sp. FL0662B]|nr:MFS general substrate transporter [Xylariaceae sp. FL0662B]
MDAEKIRDTMRTDKAVVVPRDHLKAATYKSALVAIPRITDEFHSLADVDWYASAYQFGISAPQPLIGKVYTHFNTKRTFLSCFGIFEIGSVLCGAATSSNMLIIARAIAGLGAAGIINGAITIVPSCAPLEKRPTFYINLPIGALVALGVIILPIPEQTPKVKALSVLPKLPHYLDLVGFALFAPAIIQLLLALQYGGNQYAWGSSEVIGLLAGCAATILVWFCWNKYKGDAALLPPSTIRRRAVWTAALFNACQMAAIYGALYYLPIYFQAVKNQPAILSGVYIMPTFLPQLLTASLAVVVWYVIPLAVFSAALLSIGSGLLSVLRPDTSVGKWVGYQLLTGVGSGAGLQLAIIAIQGVISGEELSSGMAFMVFTQSLFPAVILSLCNLILVESLNSELPKQAPHADTAAIVRAGATRFRTVVSPDDLPSVIQAYASNIDRVFYPAAGVAAASGVFLWGMGWRDLRKKETLAASDTGSLDPTATEKTTEEAAEDK